jgi:hypothetical protein
MTMLHSNVPGDLLMAMRLKSGAVHGWSERLKSATE